MSSFICDKCDVAIVDSHSGYITGCRHYPKEKTIEKAVNGMNKHKYEMIKFAPNCDYLHDFAIMKRANELKNRKKPMNRQNKIKIDWEKVWNLYLKEFAIFSRTKENIHRMKFCEKLVNGQIKEQEEANDQ